MGSVKSGSGPVARRCLKALARDLRFATRGLSWRKEMGIRIYNKCAT